VAIRARDRFREGVPLNRPSIAIPFSFAGIVKNFSTIETNEIEVAAFKKRWIDDKKWFPLSYSINQLLERFTQFPNVGFQLGCALSWS